MEHLVQKMSISSRALKRPVVLCYNSLLTHKNAYGTTHYERLLNLIKTQKTKAMHLQNPTNNSMNIEQRGAQIA